MVSLVESVVLSKNWPGMVYCSAINATVESRAKPAQQQVKKISLNLFLLVKVWGGC